MQRCAVLCTLCLLVLSSLSPCHSLLKSNQLRCDASIKRTLCSSSTLSYAVNGITESTNPTTIQKRVLQSFLSFGLALTAFSISSQAIDLPLSYTSEDKSIVFKHTEDLQFSPKPLKTHDKEILFKSELIKGFNAGVTVSL